MGKIKLPEPVKLFIAEFSSTPEIFPQVEEILREIWGEIDYHSPLFNFDYTDYYEKEMGRGIKKKFISFENLISPQDLKDIKLQTNQVEEKFKVEGKRKVNLDPGYLSLSKVILASTKDYYHRIYLGEGIYAEVTLHYRGGTFNSFPWTYPDYRSDEYQRVFQEIRKLYYEQLRKK